MRTLRIRLRIPNTDIKVDYLLGSGLRIRIHFIQIRHFRLNTDPDPDPIRIRIQSGSRALMTKN